MARMREESRDVCSIGLGLASTLAMPIVLQHIGVTAEYVTCLLPNEHPDAYRLMDAVQKRFNIEIKDVGTGKSPIQVFREQNFLGNTLFDNCSRVLKREAMAAYMRKNHPNGGCIHVGIGSDEIDREMSIRKNWTGMGYDVNFPLIDKPYINRVSLMALCERLFGFIPEMYKKGFKHNNCHGACIKAGKKQWLLLLLNYPDVYNQWEECERDIRASTGKNIAILRETVKGVKGYVTLEEFRLRRLSIKDLPEEAETGCKWCEAI